MIQPNYINNFKISTFMKKYLIFPALLLLLQVLISGCEDPTQTNEKQSISVLCENATRAIVGNNLIFEASNEDWTIVLTLLDGAIVKEGKYEKYQGTITSFTEITEDLKVVDAAVYKFINDSTFKIVAKMEGEQNIYDITLKGIVSQKTENEEGEIVKIVCETASLDTINSDLVISGSTEDWSVAITLLDGINHGEGTYETYLGTISSFMGITKDLQATDPAVYKFINDSTFKLVATMLGDEDTYQITLKGVLNKHISEPVPDPLLSPDEQKNFLVEVGEQLINTFNPADQKKAVELADDLYYKYKKYDWEAIEEEFEETYNDIYSAEFESFFGMPKRVINAINGKQKASMQDLEILLTLSKFGHLIEFDDKTKSVKITKTDDASILAKFSDSNGVNCELKVWGEGKEIEGSYTYEDYHWEYSYDQYGYIYDSYKVVDGKRTIRVEVPTIIKMYLKHGTSSLVSMTFKWDSNLKDYVNTSMKLQVINLSFEEDTKVSTSEASAVFSFSYSNKNIITAAVNLPKYKLIDWEGGQDITEDEGYNWLEEYEDKYRSLLGKLGKGEAKLDILGKVQLKGGFTDGAALVDAYYNWEDEYYNYNYDDYRVDYTYTYVSYWGDRYTYSDYYNAWWKRPYYSLNAKQEQCNYLNKYAYLSVYYNKGTTEQAKVLMDTYEENGTYDPVSWMRGDSDYTNLPDPVHYTCYEIEPIMFFPYDETQIAVMTYFNSSKFLGLIDLVEDLANSYVELDKHNLIFDDDFKVEIDY